MDTNHDHDPNLDDNLQDNGQQAQPRRSTAHVEEWQQWRDEEQRLITQHHQPIVRWKQVARWFVRLVQPAIRTSIQPALPCLKSPLGIPINVSSVFLVMAKYRKVLNQKVKLLDQVDAILDKAEQSGDPEEFEESLMEAIETVQFLNQQIPEKWLKKNIGLVIKRAGEASEDDGDYDDDQPQITVKEMGAEGGNESKGEHDKHKEEARKVLEEALYVNKFHDVMGGRMRELVISATSVLHVIQQAESTKNEAGLKRCMKVLKEAVEDVASRVTQPSNQAYFKQDVSGQMKMITDLLSQRFDAKH